MDKKILNVDLDLKGIEIAGEKFIKKESVEGIVSAAFEIALTLAMECMQEHAEKCNLPALVIPSRDDLGDILQIERAKGVIRKILERF